MSQEVATTMSKFVAAGWAYVTWRALSQASGFAESYTLGFGSEMLLPFLAGTLGRVGTAFGAQAGHAKHLLHAPALAFLLYEMDGNTVVIDDAIQYFGGDSEWWIEKPTNPVLAPYMLTTYIAGYYASTAGQKVWNRFRSRLEEREMAG